MIAGRYRYSVTTPPSYKPVSVTEAKTHMRVTGTTDDTYIGNLIDAAVEHCQDIQGRAYVTQTITLKLDEWPDCGHIYLPRAPLQSVTSVTYTPSETETPTTFSSSYYRVDTATEPGRIVLKDEYDWPTDELIESNGISIVYVAGYGTASGPADGRPTTMPHSIVHALKLLVAHWYENREAVADQSAGNKVELPIAFDRLLSQYRVEVIP